MGTNQLSPLATLLLCTVGFVFFGGAAWHSFSHTEPSWALILAILGGALLGKVTIVGSQWRPGGRRHGPNEIAEKRKHLLLKLLSYFWGPIPWMIEVAAALAAVGERASDPCQR